MISNSSLTLQIVCGIQHWSPDFSNIFCKTVITAISKMWSLVSHFCDFIVGEGMNDFVQNETSSWFYLIK